MVNAPTSVEVARLTRFRVRFDPAVVAWMNAAYGRMTLDAAVRAARRRFGRARAPSRSALKRYWCWLDHRLIDPPDRAGGQARGAA